MTHFHDGRPSSGSGSGRGAVQVSHDEGITFEEISGVTGVSAGYVTDFFGLSWQESTARLRLHYQQSASSCVRGWYIQEVSLDTIPLRLPSPVPDPSNATLFSSVSSLSFGTNLNELQIELTNLSTTDSLFYALWRIPEFLVVEDSTGQ